MAQYDIDGIIFDLGSTLLEYENIPWVTLNMDCLHSGYDYLKKEGHNPPDIDDLTEIYIQIREDYRSRAADTYKEYSILEPLEMMLKKAKINIANDLPSKFFEAYYIPISKQLTIYADTITVLDRLKKSGKKIGLVSNTIFPESYHLRELDRYQMTPYFDFMIFSSKFGYRKPHEKIYNEAINLIDSSPERLLFVGDRYLEDYQGPKKCGMEALIKFREGRDYPDPMSEDVIVVRSLAEILPLVGIE